MMQQKLRQSQGFYPPQFLLHHSNTTYKDIYTSKPPCMRCLIVLENGPFNRSLTNLS